MFWQRFMISQLRWKEIENLRTSCKVNYDWTSLNSGSLGEAATSLLSPGVVRFVSLYSRESSREVRPLMIQFFFLILKNFAVFNIQNGSIHRSVSSKKEAETGDLSVSSTVRAPFSYMGLGWVCTSIVFWSTYCIDFG